MVMTYRMSEGFGSSETLRMSRPRLLPNFGLGMAKNKKQLNVDVEGVFGRKIRRLSTEAGMTQNDLSVKCAIFRTYLSRIENGTANPSLLVVVELANALDVKVADLFMDFAQ
jgi:DNA-binding XRE family transcriptional regulator